MVQDRYATLREVAGKWGIPVSWLYERRLGRHIRIHLDEFERDVKEGKLAKH